MPQTRSPDVAWRIGDTRFFAPACAPALYLVATPIGNLRDISLRALETLAGVDIIACEDTRVTRILLDAYGIKKKTVSYHEHNSERAGAALLSALHEGKSMALVSDAGTPLISDPGFALVRRARAAGIVVVPIPGASALLTALVASGLPGESFLFDGFLPAKNTSRRQRLEKLCLVEATLIFYEAPHRLARTLADMTDILGADRQICLCRELTKYFESFDQGELGALAQKYADLPRPRGEIVLVVSGASALNSGFAQEVIDAMLVKALGSMSPAQAAKDVAAISGEKREGLYRRLLGMKQARSSPDTGDV